MSDSSFRSSDIEFSPNFEETKPHHNCGVCAVCMHSGNFEQSKLIAAEMLIHLQHRGPDGAGVAISGKEEGGKSPVYSDLGSVKDVLSPSHLSGLPAGEYALGHVRYRTQGVVGAIARQALQPFPMDLQNRQTVWVAHNGQFSGEIDDYPSDTIKFAEEVASRLVARVSLEEAIVTTLESKPNSAYSLVFMAKEGILAVRDPMGLHPLFYGYSDHLDSHLVASETPALTNLGVHDVQSLDPGYMLKLQKGKDPKTEAFVDIPTSPQICSLEAIYFARADGMLENEHIYELRKAAGRKLAEADKRALPYGQRKLPFDVVIATPDSARAAAQGYAAGAGIPYEEGMIKATSDRSFLQSTQDERRKVANHKLQIIPSQIEGRRVVVVEDSIVRGNTLIDLVKRLKYFGAKEVHLRIASPPLMDTCEYGIDISTRRELIAFQKKGDVEAIRKYLHADSLRYIDLEDLRASMGNELGRRACTKCFDGQKPDQNFTYRTPFVTEISQRRRLVSV